ncbi:uncharacterized protein LOC142566696 [Dermacentor variabilis]|uniref:uncharacterized protein LOC142566696 n=1 Tax=Dermacentor variabilis TaxID=34621 RepID=UPI003F5B3A71
MAGCSSVEISQLLGGRALQLHRSRSLHSAAALSLPASGQSWCDAEPLRRRSLSLGARCLERQLGSGSPDLQLRNGKGVEKRRGGRRCQAGEPEFVVYALARSPGVTCLRSAVRVAAGPSSAKTLLGGQ